MWAKDGVLTFHKHCKQCGYSCDVDNSVYKHCKQCGYFCDVDNSVYCDPGYELGKENI